MAQFTPSVPIPKNVRKTEPKSVVEFETNFIILFICFVGKSKDIAPRPVIVKVTDSLRCNQPTV